MTIYVVYYILCSCGSYKTCHVWQSYHLPGSTSTLCTGYRNFDDDDDGDDDVNACYDGYDMLTVTIHLLCYYYIIAYLYIYIFFKPLSW